MTQEDREILNWYYYGFHDELNRKTKRTPKEGVLTIAYRIGVVHAIIGDDIPSIDYLSDKETLKIIKDEYQKDILQD